MARKNEQLTIKYAEKSWKFEGYCFLICESKYGKQYSYKRKMYHQKKGNLIVHDSKVYRLGEFDEFNRTHEIEFVRNARKSEEIKSEVDNLAPEVMVEVKEEVKPVEEIVAPAPVWEDKEVFHEKFGMIKACIENNIPVYLAGPAGSGKNHTLEQIAKQLDLDFYFTNSVQQEYKLTGFIDAGGEYHETEFFKAFNNGGLFFLDEMDASIPEVLVLLNAAIANGYFEFPIGRVDCHENFRVVAAGNTVGNGADEQYTGRMVLDQATLDRFAVIDFDYDMNIELALAKGNAELVKFIRQLREEAKDKGVRATFSYRCITMVRKLEGAIDMQDILLIAVMKGFDKDTIRTFHPAGNSKYHEALRKIQGAA